MAPTSTERTRKHRLKMRLAAQAAEVADDAPVRLQVAALAREAMVRARACLANPKLGMMSDARAAAAVATAVLAIEKDQDTLVEREAVRRCWLDAMTVMMGRFDGLLVTLPEQLMRASAGGEAAVAGVLDDQLRAVLSDLQASPATWPATLRFGEKG